jgi:hypothetical protein
MKDVIIKMLTVTIVIVVVKMELPPCEAREKMGCRQFMRDEVVFAEVEMVHSNSSTN